MVKYDQGDVEKEKPPCHLFGDVTDKAHLVQRQLILSCSALDNQAMVLTMLIIT